jgi:hypothetical protein
MKLAAGLPYRLLGVKGPDSSSLAVSINPKKGHERRQSDTAEGDARDEPVHRGVVDRCNDQEDRPDPPDEAKRSPKAWRQSDRRVDREDNERQQEEANAEAGEQTENEQRSRDIPSHEARPTCTTSCPRSPDNHRSDDEEQRVDQDHAPSVAGTVAVLTCA